MLLHLKHVLNTVEHTEFDSLSYAYKVLLTRNFDNRSEFDGSIQCYLTKAVV